MKTESTPTPAPVSVIDTSKMSRAQRDALELTEAARETSRAGFVSRTFMGEFDLGALHPFPLQRPEDRDQGDAFLAQLQSFLSDHVDPDEIDRSGEIPDSVFAGLARLGAFGIKVPVDYGGLGLSQTNYCRAAVLLGSYCGNLTALLSAHQSIGVPQPLILFGSEEQKRRFLPRVAAGEVSAFALTETGVGSDPAKMETHAEPTADGAHFILNGEKLWCTNGVKAGVIVVMARTPVKDGRNQITAFLVEMDSPGVEVVRRCHFMGLRALYNGVIRFTDVKVPRENILLAEGKGLRVALTTLNTGRLTLPAACVGLSKRCLGISRRWAAERVQWGAPIGKHAAIAGKLARMAAETFAMEAMTFYAASLVDRDKHADVRLEAAMCKLWATERSWEHVHETMQIRGGRGYETAASLAARGDAPIGVERMMRDSRINLIFEGSSEIMRLFIAREALDPHLRVGAPVLDSRLAAPLRLRAAVKAGLFYAAWYPRQWIPVFDGGSGVAPALKRHVRWAGNAAHRLARSLFHAMARSGPKLEREQLTLGRFVDIGAEIFALTAACSHASALGTPEAISLADLASHLVRNRVAELFRALRANTDKQSYRLAQQLLAGVHAELEKGVQPDGKDARQASSDRA